MKLIERNLAQIVALCKKHKVVALYVFGSALTNKFNKDSDVDFSVIFDRDPLPLMKYGDNYFNFKFALEDLLHRDVDLIEYNAIRNPYFKEELDETWLYDTTTALARNNKIQLTRKIPFFNTVFWTGPHTLRDFKEQKKRLVSRP